MSKRTPEQLAAQALREGLDIFWPDKKHWARQAFYKQIWVGVLPGQARCVEQMIQDSVARFVGPNIQTQKVVRHIARLATIAASGVAFDPVTDKTEWTLLCLNDHPDTTYEKIRGCVETAVRELEKVE